MKIRPIDLALLAGLALCASALRADTHPAVPQILIGAGKSHLIDTEVNIERVSIAAPETAEAVPVSARTLMINGKSPGDTTLILWLNDGTRQEYDVTVRLASSRIDGANIQMEQEFEGRAHMSVENASVYLTGTVRSLYESQRAVSIAETLGKVVNLLKVEVPKQEPQILLKVRFANVDRTKSKDLGISFVGAPMGFPFSVKTGAQPSGGVSAGSGSPSVTLSDALNLLFFDPQINVGATLKDLESRAVLQILAEPNLLAMNGHEASFVAGGEFPYPTLQGGGSGLGQVTVQFRPFGVQIRFLPTITPRGTIRLHLAPEVSSLDYSNALTVQGSTVPAFNTRKVDTEIELESGQSFAIAGLLDQRTTESLSRIPGLADIPILGKLFTSKTITANNSELLVIVTPEFVAPISDPKNVPDLERPLKFLEGKGIMNVPPRTPGADVTGAPAVKPRRNEIPVQEMQKIELESSRPGALSGGGGSSPAGAPGTNDISGPPVGSTPFTGQPQVNGAGPGSGVPQNTSRGNQ
jgi:pilus assembly protein CpaC